MLDAPKRGCLNIHASLLPRWRGAGPIQAAILAGDTETGITIMQMEAGLDTGPMLLRQSVPITPQTTTATLHDTLAAIGAALILAALDSAPQPLPQDRTPRHDLRSEADPRERPHRLVQSAVTAIDRQIRAFDPWPGTFTTLGRRSSEDPLRRPHRGVRRTRNRSSTTR